MISAYDTYGFKGLLFSLLFVFVASVFYPPTVAVAFDREKCGKEECSKCHSLTKSEAANLISEINMKVRVSSVKMSQVQGLWEIDINNSGKNEIVYMDFSKKYLIAGPVVEMKTKTNKTSEQLKKLDDKRRVDVRKIPTKDAVVLGDKSAKTKIIVFTDPECPFCSKMHEELKKVIAERSDIAFIIKLFPLEMHKDAYWKSKAIACTSSVVMLNETFEHKPVFKADCDTKEIDNNLKLGRSIGVIATPTLIAPDGRIHSGYMTAEDLLKWVSASGKVK